MNHISCSREVESMGECENWTSTLPSVFLLWELESRWTLEFLESNFSGQNTLDWKFHYIIKNLLERRGLKWARMTHLDIWKTSYGQKKSQESNWQFDSRPLKVWNRPNSLTCMWRPSYHWKDLNKGYNFVLDLNSIEGLHKTLCALKITRVPILAISRLPLGNPGTKCHLDFHLVARHKVYYKGEGGGFPQV